MLFFSKLLKTSTCVCTKHRHKTASTSQWTKEHNIFLLIIRTDENCSFYAIINALLTIPTHATWSANDKWRQSENGYWLIRTNKSPLLQKYMSGHWSEVKGSEQSSQILSTSSKNNHLSTQIQVVTNSKLWRNKTTDTHDKFFEHHWKKIYYPYIGWSERKFKKWYLKNLSDTYIAVYIVRLTIKGSYSDTWKILKVPSLLPKNDSFKEVKL